MDTLSTLNHIVNAAMDLKAIDLTEIDMESKSSLCDYILICHGTSTAHAQGISDNIHQVLKNKNVLPIGTEGYSEGRWILMDYNAVIIHIFIEDSRGLYNLEDLYQDFPTKIYE